jgi:hypothetical protein
MVWEESPIGEACPWLGGERAEEAAASEVMDMVRRDRHHPSVVIWGLADEKECATSAGAEKWLRNLRKQVRELDPKRPVVINPDSLHRSRVLGGNDLLDFQEYLDVPENIAPPRTPPESSFPSLGSINSAFGAWGFPRTGDLEKENVYDRRFARLRELFDALRLNDTFPSLDHFCEATQVRQFETIQHHVDRYRLNPKVKGYILRQGRDTPFECTGIADFCGRPRSFEDRFVGLNAPLRVVVQWPTRNFWGGESLGLPWALSNARGRPVPKWTVKYQFSIGDQEYQEAQIDGGAIEPAETVRPEPLVLGVPEVEDIIPAKLTFKTSAPGIQPSESAWRFWLYPPLESVVAGTTSVNVPGSWAELWKYVPRLEAASVSACDLMISREWSPSVEEFLEKGGAVLLAAERFAAGKVGVEDGIKDPHKTSFVRRYHPVFAEFPNCFAVDWRFHELVPRKLLSGVRYPLIGYFRGWDYLGAAMAEFRVGRGRLLVTTLRFDHLGIDPMTSHLLYAMIQYVADDRFRPVEMLAP